MSRLPSIDVVYSDMSAKICMVASDTVQNYNSIDQKIMFVIGTQKGSRKYRPLFGSDVLKYLFEPFDDVTADWIQTYTRVALEDPANGLTEDVTDINCSVFRSTNQDYLVIIQYRCPRLEQIREVKFSLQPQ